MKIKVAIGVIVVAAVAVSLAGTTDPQHDRVRVAFFPNIGHAIPIVGLENQIFSENLGDIQISPKLFDSGPQVIESLFANSIDMAYVGPGPAVNGFIKSEERGIVILAGAASGGASLVVHPDSDIESAEDFAGKRIAAPQIANTQDVSLRHYLSEHGLRPAEKGGSVYVLNVPNSDIYTLFVKGDIDAAWVPEPWATIFVDQLGGKRVFQEEELWPDGRFASVLLVARAAYAEENPEIVGKWIESHKKAEIWINQHPQEARVIFNAYTDRELGSSFPDGIIDTALSNIEITSDPVADSISVFAQRADSLGYLGRHGYNLDGIFYEPPDGGHGEET